MREISLIRRVQIGVLLSVWGGLSLLATGVVFRFIPWGGGVAYLATFFFFWFLLGTVGYRAIMALVPLPSGDLIPESVEEWVFQVVHLPFTFFLFNPIVYSGCLPVPLSRMVYRFFGARIGKNTYPGRATIYDPFLVTIGNSVIMGHQSTLVPHVMEGGRLGCFPIEISDDVTIGVNAVILAGVTIGKGAVVAAGAVVPKFTCIGPHEIWGGIPARRIGLVEDPPAISASVSIKAPMGVLS